MPVKVDTVSSTKFLLRKMQDSMQSGVVGVDAAIFSNFTA